MSNTFTLDSLREEADKRFAPVKLDLGGDTVSLRNILRLSKKDRETVLGTVESLRDAGSGEGEDDGVRSIEDIDNLAERISKTLKLIAGPDAGKLMKALDGDLGLLLAALEHWLEATSPGEAQSSPDSSTGTAST